MRIPRSRDALSGVVLVLIGGSFAAAALQFDLGTAARPGAGYFPFGLGVLLVLLGLGLAALGLRSEPDAAEHPIAWRALAHIAAAIVVFALALPRLGLVITFPLTVLLAARASTEFRWREALLNAVVLTVGSWLIFVVGLKLPLPLWPQSAAAAGTAVPATPRDPG